MKRYAILPILVCFFFSACSEMPIDYLNSRPHKSIRHMEWLPDGQSFVAAVNIPVSTRKYEYRFYTYNSNGEKIAETPPLNLRYDYLAGFYLSADGKYAVVDNSPVEIVE